MELERPVFILGNPRSGTSLLRLMLNSNPGLCIPPECGFIEWWYDKYKHWSIFSNTETGIVQYISDLKSSKKIETWRLDFDFVKELIQTTVPDTYGKLSATVYLAYAQKKARTVTRWGDKNNYYINRLHQLLTIYPDAQFLLIVRDGRDVACSYKNIAGLKTSSPYKPQLPVDIGKIAAEWSSNNSRVLSFFQEKNPRLYIVRYEDLIRRTEGKLKDICTFLHLPYHDDMLNYFVLNQLEQEEPVETIDWKKKTLEKPDENNIGKYKFELSAAEVNEFNNIAFKTLDVFGYER